MQLRSGMLCPSSSVALIARPQGSSLATRSALPRSVELSVCPLSSSSATPMQAELGDIVYVELPEVGSEVTKSEQFGVVESVKASIGCRRL